jgi:hypothetical protein
MNNEPSTPIRGGYIIFARRFIELLADMPLLDRALWVWLYCKANHKDYAGGLVRGELLTTIDEMRQAMRYRCGYTFRKPGRMVIWRSLERYRNNDMIVTRKTTRGLIITIRNYDFYQDPAYYERNANADTTVTTDVTEAKHYKQECNKNEKKEEGGKPTNFSSKPSYLKTFDELARERADAAFERAARRFLADEQN